MSRSHGAFSFLNTHRYSDRMYTRIAPITIALALLMPAIAAADVASDVHITESGLVVASNVVVMQKNGNNLFVRGTWGQAYVRMTLLVSSATAITKEHGEVTTIDDIKAGDLLDVTGQLSSGADSILFIPKTIVDHALQSGGKSTSGTVTSVDSSGLSFALKTTQGTITVSVPGGMTFTKGARQISLTDLAKGDRVTSVSGTYDYVKGTLAATSVTVYQDPSVFKSRNFAGTLVSLDGTALPTTARIKIGGETYTVYLSSSTSIMRSSRASVSLTRFQSGDSVRLYGAIRQTDLSAIDAEVIRDLAF